jgi:hypothetical protein
MNEPKYPAARTYAPRIADHFARHRPKALQDSATFVPQLDVGVIESLIDAAFWASLQREEGYSPEISLVFLPPERTPAPLLFAKPIPLGPRALTRLAPAVERPGIHLGVRREGDALHVWGTTRSIPSYSFVVEVLGPGLLVVKHRIRDDSAKFRNVAVFEGDQVKVLTRDAADAPLPPLLRSLVVPDVCATGQDPDDLLLRLAVSMRAHRRGGTLLVVPAGRDDWEESILRPLTYAVAPPFSELRELMGQDEDRAAPSRQAALGRVVDALAGLTAVDGATVITDRYELLAFGAKIGRRDGRPRVERLMWSEPVEGGVPVEVSPSQLGGTRHNSAAQFAQDQHDAVALVASQDGRFTTFAWSAPEDMVHARRVETLLL